MSDRLFMQMLNTVTCDCIDVLAHLPARTASISC